MSDHPVRVAVVGGGIGGVASALFLRRAGVEVTVYEQASALRELGLGLQISPNAVRLLSRAGVRPALAEVSAVPEVIWQFHRWENGKVLSEHRLTQTDWDRWAAPMFLLRRARLLDIMVSAVDGPVFRLGHRCAGADPTPDGEVELRFEGSDERPRYDAVIVADGMRSTLRTQHFGYSKPIYSGYIAFRTVVPLDRTPLPAHPVTTGVWLGPDRHFVHYPIDSNRALNLVCAVPDDSWDPEVPRRPGTVEEFLAAFAGWHPTVHDLIAPADEPGKFALYYGNPLPTWTADRLALLGDAAHPMLSFFAQGSAQAVEDAAVLARCLRDVDRDGVPAALRAYEAIRRPRGVAVQENANGRLNSYHFPDGPEQEARDAALATADPFEAHSWVYEYDAEKEADRYLAGGHVTRTG